SAPSHPHPSAVAALAAPEEAGAQRLRASRAIDHSEGRAGGGGGEWTCSTGSVAIGRRFESGSSTVPRVGDVDALEVVVSLKPPPDTIDHLGVFEGIEIDCTSHELATALRLLIKGN